MPLCNFHRVAMFYLAIVAILTVSAHCQELDTEYMPQAPSKASLQASANVALDDAMSDAVYEAVVAISVFGICSLVLRFFGFGQSKAASRKSQLAHVSDKLQPELEAKVLRPLKAPADASKACKASSVTSRVEPLGARSANWDYLADVVRSGRAAELPRCLDRLHNQSAASYSSDAAEEITTKQLLTALRSCASARCFNEGLRAYEHVSERVGDGQASLWSILLYIAVEARRYDLGESFFCKLCMHTSPSGHDFVNMVRCYVGRRNLAGLQSMLADLHLKGCSADTLSTNKALAACMGDDSLLEFAEAIASGTTLDAIGYNTLMKLYAKAGQLTRIFELREEMKKSGLSASEVTFGILLDACVGAGDFDRAKCVFTELCHSDLKLNAVHCTTFIKALAAAGRLAEAHGVLSDMLRVPGTKPDLITYSTLVKAYADQGNVAAALDVLDHMMQQDVRPDEIIFNTVLTGCCGPSEAAATLRTFEGLLDRGLKPSVMTVSILLKALLLSNAWDEALDTLESSICRFSIEPEARLYVQIAQASLKAHQGAVALKVYRAMVDCASRRGENLDPSVTSRLLRLCAISGDHDTAKKMQDVARRAIVRTEPQLPQRSAAANARFGAERRTRTEPWRQGQF